MYVRQQNNLQGLTWLLNVIFPSSSRTRWQKTLLVVFSRVLNLLVSRLLARKCCICPLARGFYAEHEGKPFFDGLVEFMTSGPIVVSVLESENAVQRHRDLLGATNPANALAGTLRADYADSFTENGTHGSDSLESAAREIAYFFGEGEVCPRTR